MKGIVILKRSLTALLLMISCFIVAAEKAPVLLSFSGLQLGKNVHTDSIHIQNINQSCDTVLYWPDTVLNLSAVGVFDHMNPGGDFILFPNVPNPFSGQTVFRIFLPENDNLQIIISDNLGRSLYSYERDLPQGYHQFKLDCGGLSLCFVTAFFKNTKRSIKLINTENRRLGKLSLEYEGVEAAEFSEKKIKSGPVFTAALGDIFRIVGYHDTVAMAKKFVLADSEHHTLSFGTYSPCLEMPQVTFNGLQYLTIRLGTQCWMAENLNDGIMVNSINTGTMHTECSNNGITEKYCYENNILNCNCYGALYDWDEMMNYQLIPGNQGICPQGFRLPSDEDWNTLIAFFGGEWEAGGKLREAGNDSWYAPNTGATNESGFTALAAGYRTGTGSFVSQQYYAYFWSSTENGTNDAYYRYLYYDNVMAYQSYDRKRFACSVRCVRE